MRLTNRASDASASVQSPILIWSHPQHNFGTPLQMGQLKMPRPDEA